MINEEATSCMLVASSYRKSCTGSAHSSPSFGGIEGGLHLGNTVVMFEDKSGDNTVTNDEVIQRYYYYPFGAETKNAPWTQQPTPTIRYQYNGKEKIDELGLGWNDYGARNYDALLGRWMGVDALAEKYMGYSGYNYVLGNPLLLIDPDGKDVIITILSGQGTGGKDLIKIAITGKILNYSANKELDMNSIAGYINTEVANIYNNYDKSESDKFDYQVDVNFSFAKSEKEVSSSDHLIIFTDFNNREYHGKANEFGGKVVGIDTENFETWSIYGPRGAKTVAHELGHNLGLGHHESTLSDNLMSKFPEKLNASEDVDYSQLEYIQKKAPDYKNVSNRNDFKQIHYGALLIREIRNTPNKNEK